MIKEIIFVTQKNAKTEYVTLFSFFRTKQMSVAIRFFFTAVQLEKPFDVCSFTH